MSAAPAEAATPRKLLGRAFAQALEAVSAGPCVTRFLSETAPDGPALVLGAGKAAAAMAAAFHASWPFPQRGLVVTRYGHGLRTGESTGAIEVIEAAHPHPDAASLAAGQRMLALARDIRADETLWFLVSGGGSSLCAVPQPGLTLEQKRDVAAYLIRQGADIRTINTVRRQLSAVKGGRLAAAAHPARVVTLAISDIPGDHLADIASGPTLPDATTQQDALRIVEHYRYPETGSLRPVLEDPRAAAPRPEDPAFMADRVELLASPRMALDAAERLLTRQGYQVLQLDEDLDELAAVLGRAHARLARQVFSEGRRVALLSGGETRVVLSRTAGRGGRNLEYLAALALELGGHPGIVALAADTDGIDGHGDHAGGMVVPEIGELGARQGLSLEAYLARQDTYAYFEACQLLLRTGPTRTNVNDFRLVLCDPS